MNRTFVWIATHDGFAPYRLGGVDGLATAGFPSGRIDDS